MNNARAKIRLFIIIFASALFLLLFTWLLSGPPHSYWPARMLLGDRTLWAIKNATKVETFRVLPPLHQLPAEANLDTQRKIAGCIVISKGKDLKEESVELLSSALLTAISSDHRRAHTGYDPGVALRLWNKDEVVDVAICFQCNNMGVVEYFQGATSTRSFSYLRSIDSVRPTLVKLVKEAFPNDSKIRAIGNEVKE